MRGRRSTLSCGRGRGQSVAYPESGATVQPQPADEGRDERGPEAWAGRVRGAARSAMLEQKQGKGGRGPHRGA